MLFSLGRACGKHCECRRNARYFWDGAASGKLGERQKHCKVSLKELEHRGRSGVFVSFVSLGVLTAEGETHVDMPSLMLIPIPVWRVS